MDWSLYEFHVSNPVSPIWNQFANDTCLPDPELPCSGKGYPIDVINATSPEHVQAGVRFARKHSIRLNIKNTGHDYLGRSTSPNSLSIWTHYMQNMEIHADYFRPKARSVEVDGGAITVGPGAMFGELFSYLDRFNRTIVGGMSRTVGVAGYVTGGGHSPLSSRRSLGADNVLEVEMIAADGEVITLNECQNTDLFWAVRGVQANPHEPDWQWAFWGGNDGRLLEIKRATDPDDIFWCPLCVGNERWKEVNGRLCRS
ncbi:hypothetical protein jhhlp_008571 [Lomentospora prolificans]|uniref:FAD-binding PCMH-type domain-containing protein n=1 Tax=Lomentospora prolificans TaxID=41688 RepID=A0A2N3MYE7_9PEZI|nr:hypothetical protein jhhlp_008571 [Lomentospora prolificans]